MYEQWVDCVGGLQIPTCTYMGDGEFPNTFDSKVWQYMKHNHLH